MNTYRDSNGKNVTHSPSLASDDLFYRLAANHKLLNKSDEQRLFKRLDANIRLLAILATEHIGYGNSPFRNINEVGYKKINNMIDWVESEEEIDKTLTHRDDDYLIKSVYHIRGELDQVRQEYPCFSLLKNAMANSTSSTASRLIKQTERLIERLTYHNLRLVMKVAKQHNFLNLPLMDVIQEGNLGLIKAIEKYQLSQETRFSTYAWWWIKQHITIFVRKQGGIVRKPENVVERMLKLVREFKSTDDYNNPDVINSVVERTDFDHSEVRYLLQLAAPDMSFDAPVASAEDSSFIDTFPDNSMTPDKIEVTEKRLQLLLGDLSSQAQTIISMRYGLDGQGQSSFREIGEVIGKSTERTRQLEQEAMKELQDRVITSRVH